MNSQYEILRLDPYLVPYQNDIELRMQNYRDARARLLGDRGTLSSFANGHMYFGFHRQKDGWVYREWAPNAQEIALIGEFNGWNRTSHKLRETSAGIWEIFIPGEDTIPHGSKIKIEITAGGERFDRIPLYSKRVLQDPHDHHCDGQFWNPEPFMWKDESYWINKTEPLLIYESHVGMSGLKEGIAMFAEFTAFLLPRIKRLGYNAVQLMGIAEHPYYGSFGYQVSNFFAVSSRFGTPEELKQLIDTAHGMGIAVFLDLVHSHAARNVDEGIGAFDGTEYQFFHEGERGDHPAWGTKLFDYGKPGVLHFLLSNIKFWLEEYHFDGFRFDGVTSMLYHDHAMNAVFDHYQKYFSPNTDTEAVTYLQLATTLAKEVNPDCVLIAEDMSGMPDMCLPVNDGGIGFDYRLGMGVPDFWIRMLRDRPDEDWDLNWMWHELTQRRSGEKVIGYSESHDQALVGDKTIMFRLADKEMYWHMDKASGSHVIDRAMALCKMIRLITCTTAGEGYLSFMGNEFGHPEWIDFPREGNGYSYAHARRRWDLADDDNLRYQYLQRFDEAMIRFVKESSVLSEKAELLLRDDVAKVLIYRKGKYVFAFNFHPREDYVTKIPLENLHGCELVLHTEAPEFGGLRSYAMRENALTDIFIASRSAVVYELQE